MSVEQTSQLIQLILNALLLSLVTTGMVVVTSARSQAVTSHLQGIQEALLSDGRLTYPHLAYLSQKRRSLRRRYQVERLGQLAAHYSFLLSVSSALVVSMRSLVNWDMLIPVSLICFVLSLGLLLSSVFCVLLALHQSSTLVVSITPVAGKGRSLLPDGNGRVVAALSALTSYDG
jgi:hypothetical protein